MPGALPKDLISHTQFPKVFAWIQRFREALQQAKASAPKQVKVTGEEVIEYMQHAKFAESIGEVAVNDPLKLKPGDEVEVFPIDSGFTHRDRGTLLTLTPNEVVVGKTMNAGGGPIRVHYQRWGFRVIKVASNKL
jgi:hypothetical protein